MYKLILFKLILIVNVLNELKILIFYDDINNSYYSWESFIWKKKNCKKFRIIKKGYTLAQKKYEHLFCPDFKKW